ncbi:MAG TPA: hypothetical protein VIG24_05860, partial [Acidimicrobiia bacterium]
MEYVVIDLLTDHGVRAAWIAIPEESGYFAEIASYGGFDSRAFDVHRPPVWSNDPMATAIAANAPIITRVGESDHSLTPFLVEEVAVTAVMPVQPNQESRFVLGIGFAGTDSDARAGMGALLEIRPLL